MLEKPDLPESLILARLEESFGLRARQLAFLPLGADVNTAVYRASVEDETPYFLKLRKGAFDEITVSVPHFLKAQGIGAIIAPLETTSGQLWAGLGDFKMILYPFVEGQNGYEATLSNAQWRNFGAALHGIHSAPLPPDLARRIPRETFSAEWRAMVRAFQAQVEENVYDDPTAAKLAAFMRAKREEIRQLVARADALGFALQGRPQDRVLCHTDIHPGNLLLGANDALYIVDWDNPVLAPKERDLMLIGGCHTWNSPREEAFFYQGYGPAQIDRTALAYYRYERIIQDIAAYCQQLLETGAGGEDREQGLAYFKSNFLPDHEIEIDWSRHKLLPQFVLFPPAEQGTR
jgi:spectinomycin phosphotransferase